MNNCMILISAYNSSEGSKGLSLQILKYVCQEAGAILDIMYCKRLEMKGENTHLNHWPLGDLKC